MVMAFFPSPAPGGRCGTSSPVNREMVHRRACELAVIAGRAHALVTQSDYEQAKWELTGVSDPDRQTAILDGGRGG